MTVAAKNITAPPLKWHGGKHNLAKQIVELMPPHVHFVEPYAGGLAVLLAKSPDNVSEVVNDSNRDLTNFWRVLQVPEQFERFRRTVDAVPFSQLEWDEAEGQMADPDPVTRAVAFFVRCRQSLAGRMGHFAPLSRNRTRSGMNEQVSAWRGAVAGLPAVHDRLIRVTVRNEDALDLIRTQDGPRTLYYLDPPYLPATRAARTVYAHEATTEDHEQLLALVKTVEAKVMISGYRSDLYDVALADWTRHDFDIANHSAGGKVKRRMTECVWCNFAPAEGQGS